MTTFIDKYIDYLTSDSDINPYYLTSKRVDSENEIVWTITFSRNAAVPSIDIKYNKKNEQYKAEISLMCPFYDNSFDEPNDNVNVTIKSKGRYFQSKVIETRIPDYICIAVLGSDIDILSQFDDSIFFTLTKSATKF